MDGDSWADTYLVVRTGSLTLVGWSTRIYTSNRSLVDSRHALGRLPVLSTSTGQLSLVGPSCSWRRVGGLSKASCARKIPYKMSQSRKRHVRERLRNVENTLNILNGLGVQLKALVCQ